VQRRAYNVCTDREAWVRLQLGKDGQYVGRPKNDGGWYMSKTVKEGSMFANPFSLKEYSLDESLKRFRELMETRCSEHATSTEVIALLPPKQQRLAASRHKGGVERDTIGKSTAHLKLGVVGLAFRDAVRGLRGKRLGCFCDESSPCHAKVLGELADAYSEHFQDDYEDREARTDRGLKRRRAGADSYLAVMVAEDQAKQQREQPTAAAAAAAAVARGVYERESSSCEMSARRRSK